MGVSHAILVAVTALTSLLPSGCHKSAPPPATATGPAPATAGTTNTSALLARNLGEVTMTNHYETSIPLGDGKSCTLTPKLLDSRNVQITLMLESRNEAGAIHDLSFKQIVTRLDRPFEVAVGNFSLALTPKVAEE
jgi:hypothetical protein